jgi:small nuclear ribonucleoprotein (snRNP)-like protein
MRRAVEGVALGVEQPLQASKGLVVKPLSGGKGSGWLGHAAAFRGSVEGDESLQYSEQWPGGEREGTTMLQALVGQKVVVDLRSEYVCLGTLVSFDDQFLDMKNADLHDLRDTDTTRENYIAQSRVTGIKRNRKRVLVVRSEIVAIALFSDLCED